MRRSCPRIYQILQFHMHFPSEHTVNGEPFAGEIHVVHQRIGSSHTDNLIMVAIFVQTTENDDELSQAMGAFWDNMGFFGTHHQVLPDRAKPLAMQNPVSLKALDEQYRGHYTSYCGSITTPPCSETVTWLVMSRPVIVSLAVQRIFKSKFGESGISRRVQVLNARVVVSDSMATCQSNSVTHQLGLQ